MKNERIITVNKYPFWLFWNYKTKAKMDNQSITIEAERTKTTYSKTSTIKILLLKYLPFLILFLLFKIPQSLNELVLMLGVVLYTLLMAWSYKHVANGFSRFIFSLMVTLLLTYTIITVIMGQFSMAILYFLEIFIVLFLLNDLWVKGFRDYYLFEDSGYYFKVMDKKEAHELS